MFSARAFSALLLSNLLVIGLTPDPLSAQAARVWAAGGLGAGLPASGGDGIANMLQLVYQAKSHHASIRGLVLHDIERPTETIGELGFLYGRTDFFASRDFAVAAGLSVVAFDTCPNDDDTCASIGIPMVAEAALGGRFIGLGIQAFGNINRKSSYAGAVLFLQLGRLRPP